MVNFYKIFKIVFLVIADHDNKNPFKIQKKFIYKDLYKNPNLLKITLNTV